tara:strand:+ start:5315 stop:6679 length:1365 start_codon:yes stop_codon:yes gene_type:complete
MGTTKTYGLGGGVSGTSEIDDNLDPSVLFESADGKDYLEIDTTDSAEKLILAGGGASVISAGDVEVEKSAPKLTLDNSAAGDSYGARSSTIQWDGVATRDSGTATTLGSVRFQHLGTGTGNRAEFVIAVNNAGDSATSDTLNDRLKILGDSGTMRLSGVFQTGDGNAGAPSHGFTSSSNTGIFHDGSNGLGLSSNGGERLRLNSTGELCTGSSTANPSVNAAAGSLHVFTGTTSHTQVHADWDELVIEGASGDRSGMTIMSVTDGKGGIAFADPGNAQAGMITYGHESPQFMDFFTEGTSALRIFTKAIVPQKGAIQYRQGTGADTATTQAVYLADTNATLIIDFANGNFGDVTLAAGVTAVKFFNVPADGTVATVTARITQDSSNRTIDYSDSAVTCYSDSGSSAVTGEIKFSGGVHHTQSTGSGDVDIVSFTSIPTGSTFNIYAAVIGQDFS